MNRRSKIGVVLSFLSSAWGRAGSAEYRFFEGEPYEVRIETYTVGEHPHAVCTRIGTPPDLYVAPGQIREIIETRAVLHELTIERVDVAIVQQLTLQWLAHEQVMKWWAESETVTIALDRWTLLDASISARQSQFRYVGQGTYFDVRRSTRAADLLIGDVDLSGVVGDDDLSVLLANWGTGGRWSTGDLDGDVHVGDDDLSLLLANWAAHVPEPSTFVLVLLGLAWRGRSRNQTKV